MPRIPQQKRAQRVGLCLRNRQPKDWSERRDLNSPLATERVRSQCEGLRSPRATASEQQAQPLVETDRHWLGNLDQTTLRVLLIDQHVAFIRRPMVRRRAFRSPGRAFRSLAERSASYHRSPYSRLAVYGAARFQPATSSML